METPIDLQSIASTLPDAPSHPIVPKIAKKKKTGTKDSLQSDDCDSNDSNDNDDEYVERICQTIGRRLSNVSALADDLMAAYRLTMGYTLEVESSPNVTMPFSKEFLERKGVTKAADVSELKYNVYSFAEAAAQKPTREGEGFDSLQGYRGIDADDSQGAQ